MKGKLRERKPIKRKDEKRNYRQEDEEMERRQTCGEKQMEKEKGRKKCERHGQRRVRKSAHISYMYINNADGYKSRNLLR